MRLDPKIKDALDIAGERWEIVPGSKHNHIRIDGKLVGILPKGSGAADHRTIKNCISQIRKATRGAKWNMYQSPSDQNTIA